MLEPNELNVDAVRQVLAGWFRRTGASKILFEENLQPANDPNDDYETVYEAEFRSNSLDQGCLGIYITTEGFIGLSIESYGRVADRLQKRSNIRRYIVVAGFEPTAAKIHVLIPLLTLIARGEFTVQVFTLPLLGLVSAKLVVSDQNFLAVTECEEDSRGRTRILPESKVSGMRRILEYRPWS